MPEIATAVEIDQFVYLCGNVADGLVEAHGLIVDALGDENGRAVFPLYQALELPEKLTQLYNCERGMLQDLKRYVQQPTVSVETQFLERCRSFISKVDKLAREAKNNLPTSIEQDVYICHRAYLRKLVLLHWTVLDTATKDYGDLPGVGTRTGDLRTALNSLKEFTCVFVSYASQDRDIVTAMRGHIEKLLEVQHVFLWWYQKDSESYDVQGVADARIENGAIWMADLIKRMDRFDVALVLTSESYVKSGPCAIELEQFLAARKDRALRILPIRVSKSSLDDNAQIMRTEWLPKGDQRLRDLTPSQVEDLCVSMLAPSLVRVIKLLADPQAVGEYQRDLKWLEDPPGSVAAEAAAS